MKGIRTIVPDPLSPTNHHQRITVQQASSTQINMDEWEMSRIQDQEVWDQYTADYYAEAAAAGRVAAVPVAAHRVDCPAGEAVSRRFLLLLLPTRPPSAIHRRPSESLLRHQQQFFNV